MREEQKRRILETQRKHPDDGAEQGNHISDEDYFYDDDEYDEEDGDDLKIKSKNDGLEGVDHQGKEIT